MTYTWILSRKHYDDKREAEALKAVLRRCLEDSEQQIAQQLGYLKMPPELVARLRSELEKITG